MQATISIFSPWTFYGVITLPIASKSNQMVSVSMNVILNNVPNISALYHPNVYAYELFLNVIFIAAIEITKPIISVAR